MWILSRIKDGRVTNTHGNGELARRLFGGGRAWWSSDRLIPHKQHSLSLTYNLAHWSHRPTQHHHQEHSSCASLNINLTKFSVRGIFYNFWFICPFRVFLTWCVHISVFLLFDLLLGHYCIIHLWLYDTKWQNVYIYSVYFMYI